MGYVIKDSHGCVLRYIRFHDGYSSWFSHPCEGSFIPVVIQDYDSAQALAFICDRLLGDNYYVEKTRLVSVKAIVKEPLRFSFDPNLVRSVYEFMRRSDHGFFHF